jgi:TolB protein
MKILAPLFVLALLISAPLAQTNDLLLPNEKHLRNIKQLTFGGENAEAYFSADGKQLIFQSTRDGIGCDQIFTMNVDGSNVKMISNGEGRTTCSYFLPGNKRVVYSSTHLGDKKCPPPPDRSRGYVWAVYPSFDIFSAKPDGSDLKQLTTTPGYDAEATITLDGKKLVFTSMRDGDLDIYTMDADGKNVRRLTSELGYDGGPFWSYDGKQIVYRAHHPKTDAEKADYTSLLKQNLIRPAVLEIFVMNADGSNKKQVTSNGKANFGPYFFPDGKRIIFSSNIDGGARNFDLYKINVDGTGLERITFSEAFDGFPMFSPDGKKLVFASNRNAARQGDTNIFIADWVE